jgi:hypothetical protein
MALAWFEPCRTVARKWDGRLVNHAHCGGASHRGYSLEPEIQPVLLDREFDYEQPFMELLLVSARCLDLNNKEED